MRCLLESFVFSGGLKSWGRVGGVIHREGAESDAASFVRSVYESTNNEGHELHAWLDELMQKLENELTTLCVRCGVPPERMSLTGAKVEAGLDGVKLSLLDAMGMDILSGLMGVVLAVVGASVCGGGGVALVSAGPVGMIAGAAAGILLALVGKSGMEKALTRAKLPLLVRKLVTDNAVKRGLSRQREEIEKAIIKALADPANGFSARLCQSLSQTLGAQMERMAKDAEMSICA